MSIGTRILAIGCALATLVAASASGAVAETVTRYPVPGGPQDIALGPDGNLWVTQLDGRIARISPTGEVRAFTAGITAGSGPSGIAPGPDGNVWFAEAAGDAVARITPDGAVTEFPLGLATFAGGGPSQIVTGPDGNLWITYAFPDSVVRMTPDGTVTAFTAGITPGTRSPSATPAGIAAGPDGNLWFTESNGDRVARITTQGSVTEFPAPTPNASGGGVGPFGIAVGPDGNLWFTEYYTQRIGRITPAGVLTEFSTAVGDAGLGHSEPLTIAAGPDGAMWFGEQNGTIGRVTMAGVVTRFSYGLTSDGGFVPPGITADRAGNLWLTDPGHNQVLKVSLAGDDGAGDGGGGGLTTVIPDAPDDRAHAIPLKSLPNRFSGRIDRQGDEDWYSLRGTAIGKPRGVGRHFAVIDGGTDCPGATPLTIKEYNPEGRRIRTIKVPVSEEAGINIFPPQMPGTWLLDVKATASSCVGLQYSVELVGGGGNGGHATGSQLCQVRHGRVIAARREVRRLKRAVRRAPQAERPRYERYLATARRNLKRAKRREAKACKD